MSARDSNVRSSHALVPTLHCQGYKQKQKQSFDLVKISNEDSSIQKHLDWEEKRKQRQNPLLYPYVTGLQLVDIRASFSGPAVDTNG